MPQWVPCPPWLYSAGVDVRHQSLSRRKGSRLDHESRSTRQHWSRWPKMKNAATCVCVCVCVCVCGWVGVVELLFPTRPCGNVRIKYSVFMEPPLH